MKRENESAAEEASDEKMVSMKFTAKDKKKNSPTAASIEAMAPDYPYGLVVNLDRDQLERLGMLDDPPSVGTEFEMMAKVKVTRVFKSASEGQKEDTTVNLQITDMGLH